MKSQKATRNSAEKILNIFWWTKFWPIQFRNQVKISSLFCDKAMSDKAFSKQKRFFYFSFRKMYLE